MSAIGDKLGVARSETLVRDSDINKEIESEFGALATVSVSEKIDAANAEHLSELRDSQDKIKQTLETAHDNFEHLVSLMVEMQDPKMVTAVSGYMKTMTDMALSMGVISEKIRSVNISSVPQDDPTPHNSKIVVNQQNNYYADDAPPPQKQVTRDIIAKARRKVDDGDGS